jgi:hypothetical protein
MLVWVQVMLVLVLPCSFRYFVNEGLYEKMDCAVGISSIGRSKMLKFPKPVPSVSRFCMA